MAHHPQGLLRWMPIVQGTTPSKFGAASSEIPDVPENEGIFPRETSYGLRHVLQLTPFFLEKTPPVGHPCRGGSSTQAHGPGNGCRQHPSAPEIPQAGGSKRDADHRVPLRDGWWKGGMGQKFHAQDVHSRCAVDQTRLRGSETRHLGGGGGGCWCHSHITHDSHLSVSHAYKVTDSTTCVSHGPDSFSYRSPHVLDSTSSSSDLPHPDQHLPCKGHTLSFAPSETLTSTCNHPTGRGCCFQDSTSSSSDLPHPDQHLPCKGRTLSFAPSETLASTYNHRPGRAQCLGHTFDCPSSNSLR